jgi:hypothetical protein
VIGLLCIRKIRLKRNNDRRPEKRVVVCSAAIEKPSMIMDMATIISSRRTNNEMILLGFMLLVS